MDEKTPFTRLLRVQFRVLRSLLLREIVTRYGRDNLGFIWLFLEPMLFTIFVALLWTISKTIHSGDMPIVAFAITGYSSVLLWRNAALRVSSAVPQNMSLLYHRQIRVLDLFLARTFLEIAGASCSFVVLASFSIAAGLMDYPADILEVLFAWGLLCWLGTALAVFIGALATYNEIAERLWHPMAYILFPLSGAIFMVDWLPTDFQELVLLNPIVHCVEILREGYFGNVVRAHYDIGYVVGFCFVLTLLGLAFTRGAESRLEIIG